MAASLLNFGICLFDVYGMALILLHQSGAKLLKDYELIDILKNSCYVATSISRSTKPFEKAIPSFTLQLLFRDVRDGRNEVESEKNQKIIWNLDFQTSRTVKYL